MVDDFKSGTPTTKLGTQWLIDQDHNNLGTLVKNPKAFLVKGGAPGFDYAARFWGHYGHRWQPWPYAVFLCDMDPNGMALDLSAFKSLQFWAKGDGKRYEAVLEIQRSWITPTSIPNSRLRRGGLICYSASGFLSSAQLGRPGGTEHERGQRAHV